MKVTWVMLVLSLTGLCGFISLDCVGTEDGLRKRIAVRFQRARERLLVWALGVAAAIVPNAPGLFRNSGADWPTSGPYLGTLASVLLLTLISLVVAAVVHQRDNYPKSVLGLNFITAFLTMLLAAFAVILAWLNPDGAPPKDKGFVGWSAAALVGLGIVMAVGTEVLVAYLDDGQEAAHARDTETD